MHLLGQSMARHGHEVTVWTTDFLDGREPIRPVEQQLDGMRVVYHPGWFHARQARTYQVVSPAWLSSVFRGAGRFDVAHVVESRSLQTPLYGLGLARHRELAVVHSAFGTLGEKPLDWKYNAYDEGFLKPFLRRRVGRLLAQTDHEVESYVRFLGEEVRPKTAIVPLGVDAAAARAAADLHRGALRQRLGIGPEVPLVIYLGRLAPKKGVERLVRCFARATAGTDARLAVVGYDQGSQASIQVEIDREGLGERATILESEHGNARFGYYADADLYAITSTYFEETSLASLEALAVGTPCLVTPEVELPYLEQAGAGRMPASSEDAITDALAELLADRDRLRAMREKAHALVDARYHIDAVSNTLLDQYQLAIDASRAATLRGSRTS